MTESDDDVLAAEALPGLDFMSQSGPDVEIVFESDSEKAADFEEGSEKSDHVYEQDGRSIKSHRWEEGKDELVHTTDKTSPRSLRINYANRQQDPSKVILYIQMEYCERKVTSLFKIPIAGKEFLLIILDAPRSY